MPADTIESVKIDRSIVAVSGTKRGDRIKWASGSGDVAGFGVMDLPGGGFEHVVFAYDSMRAFVRVPLGEIIG